MEFILAVVAVLFAIMLFFGVVVIVVRIVIFLTRLTASCLVPLAFLKYLATQVLDAVVSTVWCVVASGLLYTIGAVSLVVMLVTLPFRFDVASRRWKQVRRSHLVSIGFVVDPPPPTWSLNLFEDEKGKPGDG